MPQYHYSPLSANPNIIRLLRLLPSKDEPKKLRCKLFQYAIRQSDIADHPYEALSYVWGSEDKPYSILIDDQELAITRSLYVALSSLRDRETSRIIWVDAVCINQEDEKEKGNQIYLMATIYAKASRVIVWLGEAQDNSDQALESIRTAGKNSAAPSSTEPLDHAILQLLKRPWFRRVWVLQEVAAARHIIIKCGSAEIDGYAFCLGLEVLKTALEGSMCLVTSLIRGAIFRPGHIPTKHERLSLDICSLGELVDMYHAHEAKILHDKVYALLGMSSDGFNVARLKPDYNVPWKVLMQSLVEFLIGTHASADTWKDKEIAIIRSKGCILGEVFPRKSSGDLGGRQKVEVVFKNTSQELGHIRNVSTHWTLQTSAKSIQNGDLLCLLQGAPKPSIIRLRKDYFIIIVIATDPLEHISTTSGDVKWVELTRSISFTRDFLLIWDWEISSENLQDLGKYDALTLKLSKVALDGQLDSPTRIWDIALILGDLGEYAKAEEKLRGAIEGYKKVLGEEHPHMLQSQYGLTPLSWAAGNGYNAVVHLFLVKGGVDLDLKDDQYDRTPLSWAAGGGQEVVVKLLLETGKIEVDAKDKHSRTPLSWAAGGGHEGVVKLLLETGKAKADAKDDYSRTPLSWAAEGGHKAIVKLLLETDKAKFDAKDDYGRTPLSWAALGGHEGVVKLLLETGKIEVDAKDNYSRKLLSWAAGGGHEGVVKLLLETGKIEVDAKDKRGQTPLLSAAGRGHEVVVKLLLETGKVEVDAEDTDGQTPLSLASERGHEAVVKLLLETAKAKVDTKDKYSQTPLSLAAKGGHEVVVKLLLETGKAKVDTKDDYGRTPLSLAALGGHEDVVKLLLETGKIEVGTKDIYGRTPLSWAAEGGDEGVVKLLLETGKVEVDAKDNYNRTLLSWAAGGGHEGVVKLLLEMSKVEVDTKDMDDRTPLSWASEGGHKVVVKLLLETGKVEVDAKDDYGRTPLLWAAWGGHEAVVKLLLETGKVEVDTKDKRGRTPLSRATQRGHKVVVKILLEAGKTRLA